MNVSTWSIRNPIPSVMLFVLLTFAGLLSFSAMKVQNFPDIDLPMVMVTASLPGASPSQLENDVARKLENSIATLQGLKHVYTKIQDGSVSLTAEFELEKPLQEAVDDVRSAVSRVRADMPADLRDPIINKVDLAGQPVLAFTVRASSMDDEALSWLVDNDVARKLLNVPGVGAVNRVGGVTREIRIALDPQRLQALGASAADISRQLRQVQRESSGGRTDIGDAEQPVRTLATVGTAEELAGLRLVLSDGRSIRLSDVATVTDTIAERRSAALLDGQPVVGFEVARSRGASELDVAAGVQRALDELKAQHADLQITESFNFVTPVQEEYDGSMRLLYEGALLAVLVVWLFLRDWRATLISAVALPLSVIPAFAGMYFLGFSINVITLLALSLVIGILVDDAIVEVENIVRHLRMGKSPYQAAMEAADEIGLAVVATTFTLIAVFLPTAFMSGVAGRFFKQFGWTASLAVFASLIVARVLTPMMAAYLLKPVVHAGKEPRWLQTYMRWVAACLRHRWLTVLGAAVFFLLSIGMIPLLPAGFMPADDNSQTQVVVELPPGSTLAQTLDTAELVRLRLAKVPHVRSVYTTIGGGTAGGDPFSMSGAAEVRKATLTIQLDPREDRPRKQGIEEDMRAALQEIPGIRSRVGLGGSNNKYVLVLTGDNPDALNQAALAVSKELRTIPGLGNISSTASLIRPEIAVRPDFARAADLGVTSSAIADTLRIATVGDYDISLPKLNLSQRQVPIVVRLDQAARQDLSLLGRLSVPGTRGPVLLDQVATLDFSAGPSVIDRYDRSRNINFEIELAGMDLGEVAQRVADLPTIKNLPPGVRQATVGDAEVMGELFQSFGLAMLTGVLCIYVVLVLLFKHFLHPVTILAALPLSLGGAFVGLLIAHKSFSMPSLIGLVMLMGIATKNSILLVEYAILARRGHPATDVRPAVPGMSRWDALIDACHKRARPIIMTTMAMGAGMLPIAIGYGAADPSFRSPMAIAVLGGLITSTFLSLLVIPVVFLFVDDFGQWVLRLVRRGHADG
ncbi:efflux RND transporter permease subunit [Pigmentiphaga sp. GD03639]|uniref:efflux RND transporter permease subunit n=1 Tax=unclassified Pigmentiphaga TaxID=2626614 RepID=UPI000B418781|nr:MULTISPECIES: efflux RND transporter permease subunit [unclassified Pigmentiphaga]MDH2236106.1 efflux RND transporter permease subunit [Pigmentiphaga sp. GD03639]OVZ58146.1 RND transporter [Pigmentiphaga sp. NML030171]